MKSPKITLPLSPAIGLLLTPILSLFLLVPLDLAFEYRYFDETFIYKGFENSIDKNFWPTVFFYFILSVLVTFIFVRPIYAFLINSDKRRLIHFIVGCGVGALPLFFISVYFSGMTLSNVAYRLLELSLFSACTGTVFWSLVGRFSQSNYHHDKTLNPASLIHSALKVEVVSSSPPFMLSESNDEIAKKSNWQPLASDSASSITTHSFAIVSDDIINLQHAFRFPLWSAIYLSAALLSLLFAKSDNSDNIFGAVFFGLAGLLILKGEKNRRVILNKKSQQLTVSSQSLFRKKAKTWPLTQIYALQLLKENIQIFTDEDVHQFDVFQLNVVFKDSERIQLNVYGDPSGARNDAELLKVFLGVPVWDAIEGTV